MFVVYGAIRGPLAITRILWRDGSDIWRSPAKLWMSVHHVAMAARHSMGQTLTTGSDIVFFQNNHLTVADVAAVTFRNQFLKPNNCLC